MSTEIAEMIFFFLKKCNTAKLIGQRYLLFACKLHMSLTKIWTIWGDLLDEAERVLKVLIVEIQVWIELP